MSRIPSSDRYEINEFRPPSTRKQEPTTSRQAHFRVSCIRRLFHLALYFGLRDVNPRRQFKSPLLVAIRQPWTKLIVRATRADEQPHRTPSAFRGSIITLRIRIALKKIKPHAFLRLTRSYQRKLDSKVRRRSNPRIVNASIGDDTSTPLGAQCSRR